jgi:hypothetical protein
MFYTRCYVALIIMEKSDIKTILDSQKVKAKLYSVDIDKVIYRGEVINRTKKYPEVQPLFFEIPFTEIKSKMGSEVNMEDILDYLV